MRERASHHGAAANHLAAVVGDAAGRLDHLFDGRADAHQEVGRTGKRLAGDADHALDERLVFLDGLVDGIGRAHVLNHGAHVDGQLARRNLTADAGVDELLLAALRIAQCQRLDGDAAETGGEPGQVVDGVGLVVLDADVGLGHVEGLHQDADADEDFLALLEHQTVVAGQIGLTLHTVDYQRVAHLALGHRQLDVRRERGAAHAHEAHLADLLDDIGRLKGYLTFDVGRAIDALEPFVALHFDDDGHLSVSVAVDEILDLVDHAGHGRMHIGRHESGRLGNELPHLHRIAFGDHRLCRRADMLRYGYFHNFGHRQRLYCTAGRQLVSGRVYATD